MLNKVNFEITAGLHNEFLNYIIENQFYIIDVKPTKLGFIATCMAIDYKTIAFIARKYQCKIKIIKKKGIGFKIRKLLQRKGLIAGAAVVFLSVIFFENLIWRIDVIADDKNIIQDVYTTLYQNDVYTGAYFSQEKNQQLIQKISRDVDNVAYITMNFYKGILTCKVDKTIEKLPYLENSTTGNITASMDGVIEEIAVYDGFSNLKPGQSVQKGEILVSATFIDRNNVLQQVMPRAFIKAYCEKNYEAFVPFEKNVKVRTGRFEENISVKFVNSKFEIKKCEKKPFEVYDYERIYKNVIFLGFRLPVTIEYVRFYEKSEIPVYKDSDSAKTAAKLVADAIIESDKSLLSEEAREYTYFQTDEGVKVLCRLRGSYDITR